MTALDTAVVVVNYRTKELTEEAVASVLTEPEVNEVVVVDNASGDGSAAHLRAACSDPRVTVVESASNVGFGPAVNLAATRCRSTLLLILNSDARVLPGSAGRLARALVTDDSIGVVGPMVYEADGRTPQAGVYGRLPGRRDAILSSGWVSRRAAGSGDDATPGWISGVAMLLRRADFLALGGFDESFTMYLEDVDLCRRVREAGKSVVRETTAGVVHRGGKSWTSERDRRRRFHESRLRYFEKIGATRAELRCVRLAGMIRTGIAPR